MKNILKVVCVCYGCLLITGYTTLVARAETTDDDPFVLNADYLQYDNIMGRVVASGNITVKTKEFDLSSDLLYINPSDNIFWFEGNVSGTVDGNDLVAHKLIVHAEDRETLMEHVRAVIRSENVGGTIRFSADTLYDASAKKEGTGGIFSTCRYDRPHYTLYASRFEYYPSDRLEAHNMVMTVLGMPVMATPYWRYKLGYQNPILHYPVIGSDQVRGWFMQTTWDFFWNSEHNSLVYLDYYEKIGYGLGYQHSWEVKEDDLLQMKVFGIIDTRPVVQGSEDKYYTEISYATKLNPYLSLKTKYYFQTYDRGSSGYLERKRNTSSIALNYSKLNERYTFSFDHSHDHKRPFYSYDVVANAYQFAIDEQSLKYRETIRQRSGMYNVNREYEANNRLFGSSSTLRYLQDEQNGVLTRSQALMRFDNTWRFGDMPLLSAHLNMTPQYQKNRRTGGLYDEAFYNDYSLRMDFQKGTPVTNATVKYYWIDDLDEDTVTTDSSEYYYVRKLPEVSVGFNSFPLHVPVRVRDEDVKLLDIRNSFTYGHYIEKKRLTNSDYSMDTEKYRFGLELSRRLPVEEIKSTLFFNSSFEQNFYGTGDAANFRKDTYGLSWDPFGFFSYNVSYDKTYPGLDIFNHNARSNSPFFFDSRTFQKIHTRTQALNVYLMSPEDELAARYTEIKPKMTPWKMFQWSFSWKDDFVLDNHSNVKTEMSIVPVPELAINLASEFDPDYRESSGERFWTQPLDASLKWSLTKEEGNSKGDVARQDFYMKLTYRLDLYNKPRDQLLTGLSELGYSLQTAEHEFWKLKWKTMWDRTDGQWETNEYSVVREYDCMEFIYDYQQRDELHRFTFRIKAFANDPVGLTRTKSDNVEKWQIQGFDKNLEQR